MRERIKKAAILGSVRRLKELVRKYVDDSEAKGEAPDITAFLNASDRLGYNALYYAVDRVRRSTVKYLLDNGSEVLFNQKFDYSPFDVVITSHYKYERRLEIFKLLLLHTNFEDIHVSRLFLILRSINFLSLFNSSDAINLFKILIQRGCDFSFLRGFSLPPSYSGKGRAISGLIYAASNLIDEGENRFEILRLSEIVDSLKAGLKQVQYELDEEAIKNIKISLAQYDSELKDLQRKVITLTKENRWKFADEEVYGETPLSPENLKILSDFLRKPRVTGPTYYPFVLDVFFGYTPIIRAFLSTANNPFIQMEKSFGVPQDILLQILLADVPQNLRVGVEQLIQYRYPSSPTSAAVTEPRSVVCMFEGVTPPSC